jgi:hypothetical protein
MSAFQMELNDYPHFYLAEDGRLCSMGHHCPGLPRVLYDALIRPLRQGRSGLPLLTVHGPRLGQVLGQHVGTLRPHGVGVHHWH